MKTIVLSTFNITDCEFEKLRFEAMEKRMSIQDVIKERIFYKPFSKDVMTAYNELMEQKFNAIFDEE